MKPPPPEAWVVVSANAFMADPTKATLRFLNNGADRIKRRRSSNAESDLEEFAALHAVEFRLHHLSECPSIIDPDKF